MSNITYTVYKGIVNNEIVYIGTTIQKPADRFRWHKANKKNFIFEIIKQFDNADDMLDLEFELIQKYKPKFNKIKNRKQNLNVKLTNDDILKRIGDTSWCQKCLKRHTNFGDKCYWCAKTK